MLSQKKTKTVLKLKTHTTKLFVDWNWIHVHTYRTLNNSWLLERSQLHDQTIWMDVIAARFNRKQRCLPAHRTMSRLMSSLTFLTCSSPPKKCSKRTSKVLGQRQAFTSAKRVKELAIVGIDISDKLFFSISLKLCCSSVQGVIFILAALVN